jgi:hypothetical protein
MEAPANSGTESGQNVELQPHVEDAHIINANRPGSWKCGSRSRDMTRMMIGDEETAEELSDM